MTRMNPWFVAAMPLLVLGGATVPAQWSALAMPVETTVSKSLNPCPGIYYEEPHNQLHIVPDGCPANVATRNARAARLARSEADATSLFELEPLPLVEGALVLPALKPNVAFSEWDLGNDSEANYDGINYDGIGGAYGSLPENSVGLTRPRAVEQSVNLTSNNAPNNAPVELDGALPLPEVQQVAIAQVAPQPSGRMALQLTNNTTTDITYEVITHSSVRTLRAGESVLLKALPTPVTVTMVRPDGGFLQVTPTENTTGMLALDLDASGQFNNIQGALTIQADGQVFLD